MIKFVTILFSFIFPSVNCKAGYESAVQYINTMKSVGERHEQERLIANELFLAIKIFCHFTSVVDGALRGATRQTWEYMIL